MSLDSAIDDLYRGLLEDFTARRNALAKTLTGADRQRVSALQKPLALAWVVNQTWWHTRDIYDGALKAGARLRAAQVGALAGQSTDVAEATRRHRDAVTQAVAAAMRLAEAAGVHTPRDDVRRMLEAVSLADSPPAPHGRFVKPLQPAGFEALAGVALAASGSSQSARRPVAMVARLTSDVPPTAVETERARKAREAEQQRVARERAEAERRRQAAVASAEADVTKAAAGLRRAEESWERAREALRAAENALAALRRQ